jgi:hypothetical protein
MLKELQQQAQAIRSYFAPQQELKWGGKAAHYIYMADLQATTAVHSRYHYDDACADID